MPRRHRLWRLVRAAAPPTGLVRLAWRWNSPDPHGHAPLVALVSRTEGDRWRVVAALSPRQVEDLCWSGLSVVQEQMRQFGLDQSVDYDVRQNEDQSGEGNES